MKLSVQTLQPLFENYRSGTFFVPQFGIYYTPIYRKLSYPFRSQLKHANVKNKKITG